ncbi:MAG: GNAT family N-acetyltransferase [Thermoanaerobaculales bacterium]
MESTVGRVTVRTLRPADLERIVKIDQAFTERNRRAWFAGKLQRALADADVNISLGAEADGLLVGCLLGAVHYGEFGLPEPVAVLDTILVDPAFGRRGVGRALVAQLVKNLAALRIERVRTEVGWAEQELMRFLAGVGFAPAPRLVLELAVGEAAGRLSEEDVELVRLP